MFYYNVVRPDRVFPEDARCIWAALDVFQSRRSHAAYKPALDEQ